MSAHSASARGGWLSALVAQVSEFVFEPVEEQAGELEPVSLQPHAVIAVVATAPRCGATTVSRLLAAELAARAGSSALVTSTAMLRRPAPQSRAAVRLATAMTGVTKVQPVGRICIVPGAPAAETIAAGRYLAPIVLDVAPDGSAAGVADLADVVVVVAPATGEPALLEAVAGIVGGDPVRVANRVAETADWIERADVLLPESRLAARAATLGARPLGTLGSAIGRLADAVAG